jgi:hypothetical protein
MIIQKKRETRTSDFAIFKSQVSMVCRGNGKRAHILLVRGLDSSDILYKFHSLVPCASIVCWKIGIGSC